MDFNNEKAVDIYMDKTNLFQVEKEIFKQYLTRIGVVLDLGAGTGRTTRHIKDLGNLVIGSDISPLMVKRARELHPDIEFRIEDACDLPYDDNEFDAVVFSFNGLDYIYPEDNRVQALKEIRRILAPDGIFIFSSHDRGARAINKRARLRRPRRFKGRYMKEKTVYGDLITYYGRRNRNLMTLRALGFRDPKYYDNDGKSWRYYVAWA